MISLEVKEEHSAIERQLVAVRLIFCVLILLFSCCLQFCQPLFAGQTVENAKASLSPVILSVNPPEELVKKTRIEVLKPYPFSPDGMMWLNGEPQRVRCSFDSDRLDFKVSYGQRQIVVYPLGEYRNLFKKPEQLKEFDKRVNLLKAALRTGKTDAKEIAVLPSMDACQLFRAQVSFVNFKSGRGVRFLTTYATDVSATTGNDVFYTFQGLTQDQKYWVSVFYPLKIPDLRSEIDPVRSKKQLDGMASNKCKPDLNKLDAMVQSISVK